MESKSQEFRQYLKQQIRMNRHLIGVATGSGLTAKHAEKGGADFLLALNSGRFRQMGVSSLALATTFETASFRFWRS